MDYQSGRDGDELAIARQVDCLSMGIGVERNLRVAREILEKNAAFLEASESGKVAFHSSMILCCESLATMVHNIFLLPQRTT